jgi:hypothetical protein
MQLTDEERAMADGRDGPAVQRAMDLLLRYGRALGAERLVANNIVARQRHNALHRDCAPQAAWTRCFRVQPRQRRRGDDPKIRPSPPIQLGFVPDEPNA